jgi:uncharacterized protein
MIAKKSILSISLAIVITGCVSHMQKGKDFEGALTNKFCSVKFFNEHEDKIKRNSDVIYTGISAGLVARSCKEYDKSNMFFDAAEESYKNDVDLQGVVGKGTKTIVSTLVNENVLDYSGTQYERIMVNSYKGLNPSSRP